jgi:hypothetical protein
MIMIMMIGFVKKRKKKTKQIFFLLVRIGVVLESYWSRIGVVLESYWSRIGV